MTPCGGVYIYANLESIDGDVCIVLAMLGALRENCCSPISSIGRRVRVVVDEGHGVREP